MFQPPSLLSLLAAGLYAVVACACLLAWSKGRSGRQPYWHGRVWLSLAAFFVVLLAMRITGFEEALRDSARAYLRAEDAFEGRRDTQRIIIAAFLVVGGALGMWLFYKLARGSKRTLDVIAKAASLAGALMLGLLILRFVSLHAIDRLLYGSLKLNWVGDIGASCAILLAAGCYVSLIRQLPKPSRR